MSLKIEKFKDYIEKNIQKAFEQIFEDEVSNLYAKHLELFEIELEKTRQKVLKDAKHSAQKMTLQMMQKIDLDALTVEFKI